jgi:colicin import membrane protein
MARKFKVFRTHLGFYDMIVAAPSQKAALDAWGASPHLFAQGFATAETAPRLVAAAIKKPGVVLRRQLGSKGEFRESAGALRAPKASTTESPTRREHEKMVGAAAKREKRQATKEQQREETLLACEAREEQLSANQQQRKEAGAERAEQSTAAAYAKKYAAHRHNGAKAKVAARQALQRKLQSTMRERKEKLRDIERREGALAKERRELEQSYETRIVAIHREHRKL